jgi:preprotein translocase subunit SecG
LYFFTVYDIIIFVKKHLILGGIKMGWLDWTISILTVIVGLILTIVTMLQTSKGSQSSITGANTFYGVNKSRTLDGILSKYTVVLSLVFIVLCFLTTVAIIK